MNPNCGTAPKGGAIYIFFELALFLLTRLTWTENSFIKLISKITCISFTLVFCNKNVFIEKTNVHSLNPFCLYDHFVIV